MLTEAPGAKTTVVFHDIEVTATKDRGWHVEAAGRSASAEFWIRPSSSRFPG
jgi:hypothetical protein